MIAKVRSGRRVGCLGPERRAAWWLPVLGACALLLSGGARAVAAEVVVVAHEGVPVTALSAAEVRDIFLGNQTQWRGGGRITLVLSSQPDARAALLRDYVNRTDAQFRNHWRRIVFTGRWQMPRTYDDEAKLLEYVASTPGAVSFVSGQTPLVNHVKALPVE